MTASAPTDRRWVFGPIPDLLAGCGVGYATLISLLPLLPIEQKTAFVLAEIEGLPYADIAQIEQTTLGTVKSRIHRAKQRLRAVLAPTLGEQ